MARVKATAAGTTPGRKGWRALAMAWMGLIVAAGAGAGVLQYLGPPGAAPAHPPAEAHGEAPHGAAAPSGAAVPEAPHGTAAPAAHGAAASHDAAPVPPPAATVAGAIPGPDPALLEPAPDFPGNKLPRIAPDGRASMKVYARPFDASDKRPRVALLVTGMGLSDADSRAAIALLPPAISLGFSPYSAAPDALLAAARARGHEYFVTLPMESQGYPLNNSGVRALMTGVNASDNDRNLEWVLSRMQGEVGVTGASDGLRGERFAAATGAIVPVLHQLADRGLMYIDPRPNTTPAVPGPIATVTLVIDDVQDPVEIDARLQELEKRAHDTDRVLGLVGRVRPVTMERVASWARELDARGIALVPVSSPRAAECPEMTELPYRPNVGAALFNDQGKVFVARRADQPNAEGAPGGWQLPQGGIDGDEDPRTAVVRELAEEIGTANATIIGEHPEWLTYDLPPNVRHGGLRGKFRGQRQRWFALRFLGQDSEIRLDLDPHPEFDAWRWADLAELPGLAVSFKRPIYEILAIAFLPYTRVGPQGG